MSIVTLVKYIKWKESTDDLFTTVVSRVTRNDKKLFRLIFTVDEWVKVE